MKTNQITAVPTNIITGFLGVGKTSAILHLLKNKPTNERWAVLVNEFGEIGVDGSLFSGHHSEQEDVFIREVPGGCMCCAAGVPMQVALNQLLLKSKPDRLLIEPTGLGHPKEIIQVLSAKHYQGVLLLQKTVTLVDARNLVDERYTSHDIFNQQIAIADVVIGNKTDLYQEGDTTRLVNYVKEQGKGDANIEFTQQGEISIAHLQGATSIHLVKGRHHHQSEKVLVSDIPLPECGFIKAMNKGEGFSSIGWRFSSTKLFNYNKLGAFLNCVQAERIKAVFITDSGVFAYNITAGAYTEEILNSCTESRIEIINDQINDTLETKLLECIVT